MAMKKEYKRCCGFLTKNGFDISSRDGDYISFCRSGSIGVDISYDDIVFIDDRGDFLHLPLNYYSLVGAMIEFKQLGFAYNSQGLA